MATPKPTSAPQAITGTHPSVYGQPTQPDAPPSVPPERELVIVLHPYPFDRSVYRGTRAQLEAEGLIPRGLVWPEGRARIERRAGWFWFSLRRVKPAGHKGPIRQWVNGDWWELERGGPNMENYAGHAINLKRAELKAEIHRHSAAGRQEQRLNWHRYCRALHDKGYRAFRAKVVPQEARLSGRGPHTPWEV